MLSEAVYEAADKDTVERALHVDRNDPGYQVPGPDILYVTI